MTRRSTAQSGFTLVETLFAFAIFSLIAFSGVVILRLAINSNEQLQRSDALAGQFQAARSLIRSDLAQLVDRRVRDEFGVAQPGPVVGGNLTMSGMAREEDGERLLLALTTGGNINPANRYARSRLQYVEYLVIEDTIIRRAWNYTDRQEATPSTSRVLFSGVSEIDIQFLAGPLWEDRFISSGAALAPRAIELTFDHRIYGPMQQLFFVGERRGGAA